MKRKVLKAIALYNYWRWDAAPKWGEAHEKQIVITLTAMTAVGLICALMLAVGYIMG